MKKFLKIDGVVFDLDYTIYDEHLYFYGVFEHFCNQQNLTHIIESMKISFVSFRAKSKDIFKDILIENGFEEGDTILELRDKLFDIYVSIEHPIKPYRDAIDLIRFFKKKKIKLGLLTNGNIKAQRNKVNCLSIADYFDEILYAREVGEGKEKPNIKPFKTISDKLKIPGTRLLFIGDNPKNDFKGPKLIDSHTVRLKRGIYCNLESNEFIDVEVNSLKDVKRLF